MDRSNRFSKNLLLLMVIVTSFINPFLGAAVNIALPQIGERFEMNAVSLSWVAMAYLLSSAVFLVPAGKIGDLFGRKKIFMYGNLIIGSASVVCAVSFSGSFLIVARLLQGVGGAMLSAAGMAIITAAFPPGERGRAIGATVSAVYLGLSMAPLLGGLLTQNLGWRSLFYITAPLNFLIIFTLSLFVKTEWTDTVKENFDWLGSVVFMISITAFMYGFSKLPSFYAIILTVSGILGLFFFVRIELKTNFPVLNMTLFRNNKLFAFSNLAALINYAATFAITFVLSLFLQYVKGLNPRDAGFLLVTQPLVMTIVASIAGRLSDRFDSRILSSIGMAVIVFGLVLLVFLDNQTSNTYLIFCLIILGFGFGLFSSPNTNAIMGSVEKKYLGVASATVGTMRVIGQMISMGIAAMIIHVFIGDAKITTENYPFFVKGMKCLFVIFSILCFLGIFASLARGNNQKTE